LTGDEGPADEDFFENTLLNFFLIVLPRDPSDLTVPSTDSAGTVDVVVATERASQGTALALGYPGIKEVPGGAGFSPYPPNGFARASWGPNWRSDSGVGPDAVSWDSA